MNRREAEDFVYKSYLKAEKYQKYGDKDSQKRRPDLTRDVIRSRSLTPCVVVTGSKGKGSVSNMISQILQCRYKVGLMTSPHLVDFCERFRINGKNISDDEFVTCMSEIRPEIDRIDAMLPENVCVSPMGIQTDLALTFFNKEHTEFNVFECGKGARYDDVNNVRHEYAVINSIFLEHTRELGETLEAIAADKAHVITGGQKCVYCAWQQPEVREVIKKRAEELHVPVRFYGEDFWAENIRYSNKGMTFDVVIDNKRFEDMSVPLLGEHQAKNCALAMALCADVLGAADPDVIRKRLQQVNCPGRMEVLMSEPFVMLDACINPASCKNVKDVLAHLNISRATVIIGIPDDKDYAGVAREMSEVAEQMILTRSQNPHYIFTPVQSASLSGEGIATIWTGSIEDALKIAKGKAAPIVILGTTSLVSEVKQLRLSFILQPDCPDNHRRHRC